MNSPGGSMPRARAPAQQRLVADHRAIGQPHDRLVVGSNASRIDRAAQVRLQVQQRIASSRISSSNTAQRSRPAALALYIAASASRSSSSPVR
jgi:hypothetical protein